MNGFFNQQNDRVYATSRVEANNNGGTFTKLKYPLSVMVWGCICENGASLYFIDKGVKVDSDYYCRKILPFAKREGKFKLKLNY